MPKVSVIMPVYNGERFLAKAIESILEQTYQDFEFIIIRAYDTNQASADIISQYAKKDNRIIIIDNNSKLGIAVSLNIGIEAAKGDYLARMDGDDISLPERLRTQVAFMENNTDTTICCSRVVYIDETGRDLFYKDNLSADPAQIVSDLFFFCFIHHPSVMFRKNAIFEHELYYDNTYEAAEDHELWRRASRTVKISVVPEILLKYRWHMKSASHTGGVVQKNACLRIMRDNLEELKITASEEELAYLQRTTCYETLSNYRKVEKLLNSFYETIIEKNRDLKVYDENCLIKTLDRRMYWRHHRIRRWVAVTLKSIASAVSSEAIFSSAIFLELNGFSTLIKRLLR